MFIVLVILMMLLGMKYSKYMKDLNLIVDMGFGMGWFRYT